MKLIYLLILVFSCISIYSFNFGFSQRTKMDIVSNKLTKRIGERLCKKHNMYMVGIGGGAPKGKIDHITVMFGRYQGPLNKDECRELMLDCKKVYLEEINSNDEIRPFLITYPYQPENIDLTILIFNPDGSLVLDPDFCTVSTFKKSIQYKTCTSVRSPYKSRVEESYAEALSKVYPQTTPKQGIQIFTDFQK